MLDFNLHELNKSLKTKEPSEIIEWAIKLSKKRIVTTSFGIYSAVLLKSISESDKNIPVIWCDTGYNAKETLEHAANLIDLFKLNIKMYAPKLTRSYIDHHYGMPSLGDPKHEAYSEIVKLEPFKRALNEWKPEVWFTNIRTEQTRHRNSKDILSYSSEGILKVSPFYYYSDDQLDVFLEKHDLAKNEKYFDPVKALQTRECGIHNL